MEYNVNFSFTREPSTKVSVQIQAAGLVPADNTVVMLGRRAADTPAVAQVEVLTAVADVAGSLDAQGVLLYDDAGTVAFWIDVDDSGTAIPAWASAADRAVEITTIATGDAIGVVASKLQAAIDADSKFGASVATNDVTITHTPAGARAGTGADGDSAGFSFSTTTAGVDAIEQGTATSGVPVQIENMGDPDALETEVDGLFGAGSELSSMLLAGSKAAKFSDLDPLFLPPTKAIPLDFDTPDLVGVLAANETLPMPFAAVGFSLTDATNRGDFKDHLVAISKSDRGDFGQFGSFGFMASNDTLGTVTPIAEGLATETMVLPYLRDGEVTPSQTDAEVAGAMVVMAAANPLPYNPLNDVIVGDLEPPVNKDDYLTPGDAGSISSSLAAGLCPLRIDAGGNVRIVRTVTASRRVASIPDANYFDMQDWQALYLIRTNCYNLSKQPQFLRAKASQQKVNALRSGIIQILKDLEGLEILQFVDELADKVTVRQDPTNRSAYIYTVPVNVIPGFHNKGIGVIGTTEFDGTITA